MAQFRTKGRTNWSLLNLITLFFTRFVAFDIIYTLGNVICTVWWRFLMELVNEIRRKFITVPILVSFVLALFTATVLGMPGLALVLFVAMTWYCLSNVKDARN